MHVCVEAPFFTSRNVCQGHLHHLLLCSDLLVCQYGELTIRHCWRDYCLWLLAKCPVSVHLLSSKDQQVYFPFLLQFSFSFVGDRDNIPLPKDNNLFSVSVGAIVLTNDVGSVEYARFTPHNVSVSCTCTRGVLSTVQVVCTVNY